MAALGEIYWADLPPAGGHEQAGLRPVVIVQDDQVCGTLPTVMIVPLTSNLSSSRFPCTVLLSPDAENQLPRNSVALVFQARGTDRRRLRGKLGQLAAADVQRVEQALRTLLRLP